MFLHRHAKVPADDCHQGLVVQGVRQQEFQFTAERTDLPAVLVGILADPSRRRRRGLTESRSFAELYPALEPGSLNSGVVDLEPFGSYWQKARPDYFVRAR